MSNGQDVEETVWRYLCQAQLHGAEAARAGLLAVRNDPRPVMSTVYALFAGTCDTEVLLTVARDQRARFYSQLYAGLYYEAKREVARARHHITQAAAMQVLDDDMAWLAIVHQPQRGWDRS